MHSADKGYEEEFRINIRRDPKKHPEFNLFLFPASVFPNGRTFVSRKITQKFKSAQKVQHTFVRPRRPGLSPLPWKRKAPSDICCCSCCRLILFTALGTTTASNVCMQTICNELVNGKHRLGDIKLGSGFRDRDSDIWFLKGKIAKG